jgi:hypothetical protein
MLELDTLIDFAGHAWHARSSQKWFAGQISQALEFHTNGAAQVQAAEPAFASEYSGHGKQAIELIAYFASSHALHCVSPAVGFTKPGVHSMHSKFNISKPDLHTHMS